MGRYPRKEGIPIVPASELDLRDHNGQIRKNPIIGEISFTQSAQVGIQVDRLSGVLKKLFLLPNYTFQLAMELLPEFSEDSKVTRNLRMALSASREEFLRTLKTGESVSQPSLEDVRRRRWGIIRDKQRKEEDHDRLKEAMRRNPDAFAFYEEQIWDEGIGG